MDGVSEVERTANKLQEAAARFQHAAYLVKRAALSEKAMINCSADRMATDTFDRDTIIFTPDGGLEMRTGKLAAEDVDAALAITGIRANTHFRPADLDAAVALTLLKGDLGDTHAPHSGTVGWTSQRKDREDETVFHDLEDEEDTGSQGTVQSPAISETIIIERFVKKVYGVAGPWIMEEEI